MRRSLRVAAIAALCVGCGGPSASGPSAGGQEPSASPVSTVEGEARAPAVVSAPAVAVLEAASVTVAEPSAEGSPAEAEPEAEVVPVAEVDPLVASRALTTSLGGPADGHLTGAFALPASGPGFRSNPQRPNAEAFYGTVETVRALVRAAAVVHAEIPGSEVVINDIGFREGGPITHHGSHQAGRDVDVLFYYFDRDGEPWPAKGVPIDPRGRGWDFGDLADPSDDVRVRIDVQRTWRFVQALIEDEDPGSPVQRIFVAEHVRTLLLAQAERARATRAVRDRFADLTCQPSYPHDDHLHVRFFCSAEDLRAGCMDGAPMYPWRRQQLRADDVEPVMATRRPRRRPAQRAAAAAEPAPEPPRMHSRVRAFLDQRALWAVEQHPGRRYCR